MKRTLVVLLSVSLGVPLAIVLASFALDECRAADCPDGARLVRGHDGVDYCVAPAPLTRALGVHRLLP